MSDYRIEIIIEDGKEYEVKIHGTKEEGMVEWCLNGKYEYYREKGPAVIRNNEHNGRKDKTWRRNDCFHRLDGLAAIYSNHNENWYFWYINDIKFSEKTYTKVRTMMSLGLNKV
jgi:hypothetical protein